MGFGSNANLCESCRWMREILSGKGSRFILCERATSDERYRKYPPLPVLRCPGHELLPGEAITDQERSPQ